MGAAQDTEVVTDPEPLNVPRWRVQVDNLLGSSAIELDESAAVISYEEYHPYGSTAFHSATGAAETSRKRYRYTGKERDDETGLYYHGARYYAAWLGRWVSADPVGLVDGLNLYRYSRDNPVRYSDPGGTQSKATLEEFNREGTTNREIGLLTDAELIARLKKGTDAEARALVGGATGLFQERARQAAGIAGRDLTAPDNVRVGTTEVFSAEDVEVVQTSEGEQALVPKEGVTPRGEVPSGEDAGVEGSNLTGASALTTYESLVRSKYLRDIKPGAKEAVREIEGILDAVRQGKLTEEEGLARAEKVARAVSGKRDAIRSAAQEKLSPGGRMLSQALETEQTFEQRLARKGGRSLPGVRGVAESAGRSSRLATGAAKVGRVAGPVGVVVGGGLGVAAVVAAEPEERVDTAVEEGAAFGASAAGASAGTAAGVGIAGGIAIALGLAGPPGWLVLGLGVVGGAAGGYFAGEGARRGVRHIQGR